MSASFPTFLDTATRSAAGDDGTNCDRFAIALHWLTAFLMIANFALRMLPLATPGTR